jgi:hypothetical protein
MHGFNRSYFAAIPFLQRFRDNFDPLVSSLDWADQSIFTVE